MSQKALDVHDGTEETDEPNNQHISLQGNNPDETLEDNSVHNSSADSGKLLGSPVLKRNSLCDFNKGVICSSTPQYLPAKKMKKYFQLTPIPEGVSSLTTVNNNEEAEDNPQRNETKCKPYSIDVNNLSVMEKDELSFYSDALTIEKNSHFQTKLPDDKNLTIKTETNEVIVYRTVEDRVIDETIINNLEINEAELEPEVKDILQKANNLQVFVSNDEGENKDNFDSDWEILRKLETDEDRYKAVRKTWRNLTIPNIKENLTIFNWRRKCTNKKNVNIPNALSINEKGDTKEMYSCTKVLDTSEAVLKELYEVKSREISSLYDELNIGVKQRHPGQNLEGQISENAYQLAAIQEQLTRHGDARQELLAVNRFYNGLISSSDDLMFLNNEEMEEIRQVDDVIHTYAQFYF